MNKVIVLAVVAIGGIALGPSGRACTLPGHWGGLEEQLYNQCEAQEEQNRLLQEQMTRQRMRDTDELMRRQEQETCNYYRSMGVDRLPGCS